MRGLLTAPADFRKLFYGSVDERSVDTVDMVDEVDGGLIPRHGGYRKLKSFRVARLVYDVTVRFCDRYVSPRSRTHDQMVQAARSGVQNIAEGSAASATSKKMELKLTNVARASLEELRLDYEDFLRHRGLPKWERADPRRQALIDRKPRTVSEFSDWVEKIKMGSGHCGQGGQKEQPGPSTMSTLSTVSTRPVPSYPEVSANGALALIGVASALLGRQIDALARSFEERGGFTERLYGARCRRARR
jgi:four helix bundle suffix protein